MEQLKNLVNFCDTGRFSDFILGAKKEVQDRISKNEVLSAKKAEIEKYKQIITTKVLPTE